MSLFNTWQINLIFYLICVVIFFQSYKLAVRNAEHDGAATILLQVLAGISILIFIPFFGFKLPQFSIVYLFLLGACIFYAINDRLQTTARKYLQVSIFTIIGQLNNVFLIIFGLIIFKEPLMFNKILGAIFVVFGNILLLYKGGRIELNKYIIIGILATLSLAIAVSIDIGISENFNLPFYISLTLLIPALFIFVSEKVSFNSIFKEANSKAKKFYILTGIFWGLTILFSLRAYQLGNISTIVPLQATSVLLNVIVAYFVLKEKDSELKKIIAAILVIFGISITVLY